MFRDFPEEFPPLQTVYWYYAKWVKDVIWENINRSLVTSNRLSNDKKFRPAVAIIDSQSSKNSPACTQHGGKLVKGCKRFYITDTLGNL
jgi:putative transposase